jgi:hypothetical protein
MRVVFRVSQRKQRKKDYIQTTSGLLIYRKLRITKALGRFNTIEMIGQMGRSNVNVCV